MSGNEEDIKPTVDNVIPKPDQVATLQELFDDHDKCIEATKLLLGELSSSEIAALSIEDFVRLVFNLVNALKVHSPRLLDLIIGKSAKEEDEEDFKPDLDHEPFENETDASITDDEMVDLDNAWDDEDDRFGAFANGGEVQDGDSFRRSSRKKRPARQLDKDVSDWVNEENNDKDPQHKARCGDCKSGFRESKLVIRHSLAIHPRKEFATVIFRPIPEETDEGLQVIFRILDLSSIGEGEFCIKCHRCQAKFDDLSKFEANCTPEHRKYMRNKQAVGLSMQCHECLKVGFNNLREIVKHYQSKHPQKSCSKCDKKFRDSRKLNDHEFRVHTAKVSCDKCDQKFVNRREVELHVHADHDGKELFKCTVCQSAVFTTKTKLRHHMVALHKVPKILPRPKTANICKTCGRHFRHPYELNDHVAKIHEGQKNFVCEACGKAFFKESALKVHVQRVHEKLRPHKCELCPRTFARKTGLHRHKNEVHEKLLPFACDVCGKLFAQSGNMKVHKAKHH